MRLQNPFLLSAFLIMAAVASRQATRQSASQAPEVFQPFEQRAYRLVNGVAFDSSERKMFFACCSGKCSRIVIDRIPPQR